jgi:class 3 adenylate cyclase
LKEKQVERRLATILAADVVGYSRLVSENEADIDAVRNAAARYY